MISRIAQVIVILALLASSFGLGGCSNTGNTTNAPRQPHDENVLGLRLPGCNFMDKILRILRTIEVDHNSDNQTASSTDNVTSQALNIPSAVHIIDVDKITGKQLRNESSVITLTPEQMAKI